MLANFKPFILLNVIVSYQNVELIKMHAVSGFKLDGFVSKCYNSYETLDNTFQIMNSE